MVAAYACIYVIRRNLSKKSELITKLLVLYIFNLSAARPIVVSTIRFLIFINMFPFFIK